MPTESLPPAPAQAADSVRPRVEQREEAGGQWAVARGRWTAMAMSSRTTWDALEKSLAGAPAQDGRA